jgi:hypothetical protein
MAKRNKDWDDLVRRGKTEMLKAPQQFAGRGTPPAPGSPDSTRFYNESKMLQEMANDPKNANRLAQNKQLTLQGLAEESNKGKKKSALKEKLGKFKGGGAGRAGALGGGLMNRRIK